MSLVAQHAEHVAELRALLGDTLIRSAAETLLADMEALMAEAEQALEGCLAREMGWETAERNLCTGCRKSVEAVMYREED